MNSWKVIGTARTKAKVFVSGVEAHWMNQHEMDELWFSFQRIPGAAFRLNDSVRIRSGDHAEEFASVVALLSLEPTRTYLVELANGGGDLKVPETAIEKAD